ncbi:AMP-binding protein [Thalassotalea mangrovi]|uniref:AMP-binding protein n=1 Tax=Thalassotalea mangrovi TaxID=2572245 RepID=UPI00145CB9B5|nr:AMP-binding protein [Thalassotalea mangrovi]
MILEEINQQPGDRVALVSIDKIVTYRQLQTWVQDMAAWLRHTDVRCVAMQSDNSVEWVIIDLACQAAGIVFIPVPPFFSQSQFLALLQSAQPDLVIFEQADFLNFQAIDFPLTGLTAYKTHFRQRALLPENTSKITFTSGSTGEPKGVCLSLENQYRVAKSLTKAVAVDAPNHFCLLSLSTLLENIAGVYAPLMCGGSVVLAREETRGFSGSRVTSVQNMVHSISSTEPNTLILVPELLQLLIHAIDCGWVPPKSLSFIAVGGSKVAPQLLRRARQLGLPVFQGYGLSECGSVVCLNHASAANDHLVGAPLEHVSVDIEDGELIVNGNAFLGYLNRPQTWGQNQVRTGDLARIKAGQIEILGRKSNLIINSYGRNISPEWIEAELLATGMFQQAVVFGDAQAYCTAIVVPLNSHVTPQQITTTLQTINQSLPDYAQVKAHLSLSSPMTCESGLYTSNGRPRRGRIEALYLSELQQLYPSTGRKEYHHEFI